VTERWTTVDSRLVYENHWMRVREDRVRRPSGNVGLYGVIEKKPFVIVIPFDGERLYLVNQYRHPIERRLWELPQGIGDGDDLEAMARQELREEAGLRAGRVTDLGRIYVAPGMLTQFGHCYLAEDLRQESQQLEDTEEDLLVGTFSIPQVEAMLRSGEICDAVSLASLNLWRLSF
jgi:8-oxo-dGTP pyrophosphatase MutT (NUDIX family)